MPGLKHAHTLERLNKVNRSYKCIHPDCTFYSTAKMLDGKRVACRCGRLFILDAKKPRRDFQYSELKCPVCRHGKSDVDAQIENVIDEVLGMPSIPMDTVLKEPEAQPTQLELEVVDDRQTNLALDDAVPDYDDWA